MIFKHLFFFETTWSMKAISYGVSFAKEKKYFCFIDLCQMTITYSKIFQKSWMYVAARGYINIHFHDIQTSFFFETTWSMKAIPYGVSLQRKRIYFCFIDLCQMTITYSKIFQKPSEETEVFELTGCEQKPLYIG